MTLRSAKTHATGFTLLELLVALAVFAVMSAMAYGGLRTVLDIREQTDAAAQRLAAIQRAFLRIERDLEQSVARGVRDDFGSLLGAMLAAEDEDNWRLEFTRVGHRNPARLPRSTLQRVAYEVEDEVLYRVQWLTLDRAQGGEPVRVAMLEQVARLELRFLDTGNEWRNAWPPLSDPEEAGLPRAVELSVELEDWGRVTRLVALTGA